MTVAINDRALLLAALREVRVARCTGAIKQGVVRGERGERKEGARRECASADGHESLTLSADSRRAPPLCRPASPMLELCWNYAGTTLERCCWTTLSMRATLVDRPFVHAMRSHPPRHVHARAMCSRPPCCALARRAMCSRLPCALICLVLSPAICSCRPTRPSPCAPSARHVVVPLVNSLSSLVLSRSLPSNRLL